MQWVITYLIIFAIVAISLILGQVHKKGILSVIYKNASRITVSKIFSNELAKNLLEKANLPDIDIVEINSKRSNCYNAKYNVIKLSSENFNSPSIVSLAICLKEVEHAKSKHKKYYSIFRFILTPILNIISKLFIPIILLSAILAFGFDLEFIGFVITITMVAVYLFCIILQEILILPEKKISKRAIETIKNEDILSSGEFENIKLILTSIDRTYISSYLLSLLSFLNMLDYQKIMTTE